MRINSLQLQNFRQHADTRVEFDSGITGIIVNEHDDKCLDVSGGSYDDGAPVIAWPCHGGDNQRWDLAPQGGGYYTITNRQSGKCLDVTGASRDNGATVEQWSCNGAGASFRKT